MRIFLSCVENRCFECNLTLRGILFQIVSPIWFNADCPDCECILCISLYNPRKCFSISCIILIICIVHNLNNPHTLYNRHKQVHSLHDPQCCDCCLIVVSQYSVIQ